MILSRGRANSISTHLIFPEFIEVLVPDDEVEEYKKGISNPILSIPSELKGLGKVRNWCLDNFKEETVIMLDDDIKCVYNLEHEFTRRIKDKEEALEVIINTAIMAKDLGVGVFGFSQTDIRKYNACEPFKLCTWVGCVVGVIGKGIRFRNDKYKVDIDFCLQNLLVNRIVWVDNRYYFAQNRDNNVGGNSIWRTQEDYEKSVNSLKEKWGRYVVVKKKHSSNITIKLNVKRKQALDFGG